MNNKTTNIILVVATAIIATNSALTITGTDNLASNILTVLAIFTAAAAIISNITRMAYTTTK